MKLETTLCCMVLGLALPSSVWAQQQQSDAIVGEKGVPMDGAQIAAAGQDLRAQAAATRSGALTPGAIPGTRGGTDNSNGGGKTEPVQKDPKGPDKLGVQAGAVARLGQVAMDPKEEPPKDKDPPKDPKGPDKLGQAVQRDQVMTPARTRAAQQATRGAGQASRP